ncbi:hypothetical protein A3I42_02590 [Candidatus Uhrbacteria bacterium RIFCSPLOWO2_02_FULL_49_11]|uniref:DUF3800 domain-containing protein n=1 Tax=Candidatus Uhrbacteria bacterium RIFCSPLOWO2_02_FULL_49_11 TaxID=1802409 RepID=A0A1F7VB02_9BACT|nr:MAG: hypothetical protein A3I42_02590 [Candidatus Uhrbacteria bacterium RIFCSPLOWO2_02_FULL_49_11]
MSKQKLYAYVDESGQDTGGILYIVGVLVLEEERESVREKIESIERASGKGNVKWHSAPRAHRMAYVEAVLQCDALRHCLFFEMFHDRTKYIELSAYVTAKAILKRVKGGAYKATVFVDGLRKQELERFVDGLRALRISRRKVRGVRRDENDALIRLADALCGWARDAHEGDSWAAEMMRLLEQKKIVTAL